MEENEDNPFLLACIPLNHKFAHLKKILITSGDFRIGRSLTNSVCIPHLSISRNHCTFKKVDENEWCIEDHSTVGIKINDVVLGKGSKKKLKHEDIISLEHNGELFYKFLLPSLDVFETPRKRMRMADSPDCTIINDVKLKFEESQKCEIKHIEEKIQNVKQIQTTKIIHKKSLQDDMNRKIQQLENEFSVQIENLKGEKNEVEKQKASLIEERDAQLAKVKEKMEGKITELMEQIKKQYESEAELLKENSLLRERLNKDVDDFLSELNRESSSKQAMLDNLEAKIREQEEARLTERQELENTLRWETEQLRLAKEKELKEMAELKLQREKELEQELSSIKQNLAKQVKHTEQQRIKAEEELKQRMEEMNKLQAEENAKMVQLQKEREDIQKKLTEAQNDAEKSKVEVLARVTERETELAALAAERIQKQAEQSSEVITTLQDQLEKVKSQLQIVETEKNSLLENICTDAPGEGTSKEATLNEFGELMENELQCSVCAELFVEATTLNCSHTFCKYCITMWKKKKKDCPICRSTITSECKSLVLDSFIEKMVQSLTGEMKKKRQDMLSNRADLEVQAQQQPSNAAGTSRGSSEYYSDDEELEEEEDYRFGQPNNQPDDHNAHDVDYSSQWSSQRRYYFGSSNANSGSDDASDSDESGGEAAAAAGAGGIAAPSTATEPTFPLRQSNYASSSSRSGSDEVSDHSNTGRQGGSRSPDSYRPDRSSPDLDRESNASDDSASSDIFNDPSFFPGSDIRSDDSSNESDISRRSPEVHRESGTYRPSAVDDRNASESNESADALYNRSDNVTNELYTRRRSPIEYLLYNGSSSDIDSGWADAVYDRMSDTQAGGGGAPLLPTDPSERESDEAINESNNDSRSPDVDGYGSDGDRSHRRSDRATSPRSDEDAHESYIIGRAPDVDRTRDRSARGSSDFDSGWADAADVYEFNGNADAALPSPAGSSDRDTESDDDTPPGTDCGFEAKHSNSRNEYEKSNGWPNTAGSSDAETDSDTGDSDASG